jgi:hypothetical protein
MFLWQQNPPGFFSHKNDLASVSPLDHAMRIAICETHCQKALTPPL